MSYSESRDWLTGLCMTRSFVPRQLSIQRYQIGSVLKLKLTSLEQKILKQVVQSHKDICHSSDWYHNSQRHSSNQMFRLDWRYFACQALYMYMPKVKLEPKQTTLAHSQDLVLEESKLVHSASVWFWQIHSRLSFSSLAETWPKTLANRVLTSESRASRLAL